MLKKILKKKSDFEQSLSMNIKKNKPLNEICTFGIGGPATFYVETHTIEEMRNALLYCQKENLPYFILGKGSNCLFDDRGFAGMVIHNKIDFNEERPGGLFYVGAGYNFSLLGSQTARNGWSGLEFASGIPGTVGGAIFMNAGANGRETCDSLTSIEFLTSEGELQLYNRENLHFAYRTSSFQTMQGAILGATFSLTPSKEARQKQIEIITYRKNTQPYGEKSAGCIFRNPKEGHAGALIDKSALKGTKIGGAKISEIHANFIVNDENATAKDVLELIENIKKQVKNHTGIDLESEVRYIPYEPVDLLHN